MVGEEATVPAGAEAVRGDNDPPVPVCPSTVSGAEEAVHSDSGSGGDSSSWTYSDTEWEDMSEAEFEMLTATSMGSFRGSQVR